MFTLKKKDFHLYTAYRHHTYVSFCWFVFPFKRRRSYWPSLKFQKQQSGYTEVEEGHEKDSIVEPGPGRWNPETWKIFALDWFLSTFKCKPSSKHLFSESVNGLEMLSSIAKKGWNCCHSLESTVRHSLKFIFNSSFYCHVLYRLQGKVERLPQFHEKCINSLFYIK